MKRTIITFASMAILAGTSHAAISGRKPAFMDKKQLAEMRAGTSSKVSDETDTAAFFTGRPYLASMDGYAFKYRNYSPGIARWTSEDPSGFPDGANNGYYAPVPTNEMDWQGLAAIHSFDDQVHSITIGLYIHDTTNSFTQISADYWKSIVESAWTFSGTDKSNGENLSFSVSVTAQFQQGGARNSTWEAQGYNLVTFSNAENEWNHVTGFNHGQFRTDINDRTFIHEMGHFMMGLDQYTVSTVNGIRTTTPYTDPVNWTNTIMGGGGSVNSATKLDANYILRSLGEQTHFFGSSGYLVRQFWS